MTPEQCKRDLADGKRLNWGGADDRLLFQQIGLPADHQSLTDYQRVCFQYPGTLDYYSMGRFPPEFLARMRFLPDFSEVEPDSDRLREEARAFDRTWRIEHVNDRLRDGNTSLHLAAHRGNLDCMKRLLELGADLKAQDSNGASVLQAAAAGGHLTVVSFLLAKGLDPSQRNQHGVGPLHRAAMNGHMDVIDALIEAGTDVNARDSRGHGPLWWALERGQGEASLRLLKRGADPEGTDGDTVLAAASRNQRATLELMLAMGSSLQVTDADGLTPLHLAAFYRGTHENSDTIRYLLERDAAVDAVSHNGLTPVHQAARSGNLEAFRLMLEHGGDATREDGSGKTPVDYAARVVASSIRDDAPLSDLTLLLDLGVSPHATVSGRTLLHVAVAARHVDAVELLVNRGVDPNRKEGSKTSPLEQAHLALRSLEHRGRRCPARAEEANALSERQRGYCNEIKRDRGIATRIVRLLEAGRRQ
jgi:ankyrin repeat protein